jgi:hypothetical protein
MGELTATLQKLNDLTARLERLESRSPFQNGMFLFSPFSPAELDDPLYHANGDLISVDSEPGQKLLALPQAYKTRWKIVVSNGKINVPNLYASDGRGYFFRASGTPGTIQADIIRNIKGTDAKHTNRFTDIAYSGPYGTETIVGTTVFAGSVQAAGVRLERSDFDASRCVATGNENRPINVGLTPAVILI